MHNFREVGNNQIGLALAWPHLFQKTRQKKANLLALRDTSIGFDSNRSSCILSRLALGEGYAPAVF